MFLNSVKGINRLILKRMSNIYYCEKRSQNLLEKKTSRKENLKICTSFEEQKGRRL